MRKRLSLAEQPKAAKELMAQKPTVLLRALSDFANMGDSPEQVEHFLRRWPGLLSTSYHGVSVYEGTEMAVELKKGLGPLRLNKKEIAQLRELLSTELEASVRGEFPPGTSARVIEVFKTSGFGADEIWEALWPTKEVFHRRDMLRSIWRGGDVDGTTLGKLLNLFEPPDAVPSYAPETEQEPENMRHRRWRVLPDWKRGRLTFRPRDPLERACLLLLENSARAKVCANPDCPAPYFLAKKKAIQRFCSPDCLKPFQKQWKLDWWERVGKKRRRAKQRSRGKKTRR